MFNRSRKTRYDEEHYADFTRAMKEARDWMMGSPETRSRYSLAMFFAAIADTFEIDNPKFDRIKVAKVCGFLGESE